MAFRGAVNPNAVVKMGERAPEEVIRTDRGADRDAAGGRVMRFKVDETLPAEVTDLLHIREGEKPGPSDVPP
jgi:hypothetical protein